MKSNVGHADDAGLIHYFVAGWEEQCERQCLHRRATPDHSRRRSEYYRQSLIACRSLQLRGALRRDGRVHSRILRLAALDYFQRSAHTVPAAAEFPEIGLRGVGRSLRDDVVAVGTHPPPAWTTGRVRDPRPHWIREVIDQFIETIASILFLRSEPLIPETQVSGDSR